MKKTMNKNMALVIIFASVLIAGSLFYLGSQVSKAGLADSPQIDVQAEIQKSIDDYIQEQQASAPKTKAAEQPKIIVSDYSDDDPFMGDKNAPVTLIEWSDYECPFCKRFFDDTLPQIKEKYIDTGKVKFIYRDFPLSFHKNAYPSAIAAECAREQKGNEMYFKYHDLIFENQSRLNDDNLKRFAETLNLKTDEFNDCFESQKYKDEAKKDFLDGQSVGVTGTPGFLLNGRLLVGAQPFSTFEKLIEEELK